MLLERWALRNLHTRMQINRVISVVGCRQSGKTTLLIQAPITNKIYRTLDDGQTFQDALADPAYFVRRPDSSILMIDEVQKVPALIGQIKCAVDRNPEKAQYVISGSSDYRRLPHANESLAGRAGFVRVRTFTEAERLGRVPNFLQSLFDGRLPMERTIECGKRRLLDTAIRGGFPELLEVESDKLRSSWFRDYLGNQVMLDVRDQWGVRKTHTVEQVLSAAAAVSSRELNKAGLARQFGLAWATLDNYWSALEAMFLIDMVPGWAKKDSDRPGITPKPFLTDSGLMAHLLHIQTADDVLNDPEKSQNEGGKLIETWTYNQLMPEIDLNPSWETHYLRTRTHEIDLLVTNEKGKILGIEIKSGESISSKDFQHLKWMSSLMGRDRFTGIVLYAGDEVRPGGDGCYALPMSALWADTDRWAAV